MAEVQTVRLRRSLSTDGLSHSSASHLQVGYCWHDASLFDFMISQEKLLAVKG
jgi:hypothetical protein